LADRRDPAHDRAKRFYDSHRQILVMTDLIFAETMSLLTKRLGKATAIEFGRGMPESSRLRIEEPAPRIKERAWLLFTSQPDKDYDLVDCLSFAFVEALKILEVFGFDRHFAQYAFRVLPD